jgi:hypothetical protein
MNIQFEETVIVMDAVYVDKTTGDLIQYFSKVINRSLTTADLSLMLEALALDAGLRPSDKDEKKREIQTLLIYDEKQPILKHIVPNDLAQKLNNVAFESNLGEFVLNSYHSSGMTHQPEYLLDALRLVADAQEVKRLIVVADAAFISNKVLPLLNEVEGKESITLFSMNPSSADKGVK